MKNLFAVTFRGHLPVILSAKSKGSEDMKRILIVEDDSFLNKMLVYNLTADGYGVISSLNARTAADSSRVWGEVAADAVGKGVCVYTQRLYEGYDKLYHKTSGRDVYGRSDR